MTVKVTPPKGQTTSGNKNKNKGTKPIRQIPIRQG